MIQLRTVLKVADNSGAKKLRLIHIHGGSSRRFGYVADYITASVIVAEPQGQIKKGEMVKAVVVRTKKEIRRDDGSSIRFDDNAAVVIENIKTKNPIAITDKIIFKVSFTNNSPFLFLNIINSKTKLQNLLQHF